MKPQILLLAALTLCTSARAQQQPRYTPKKFVSIADSTEFKDLQPGETGFIRVYIPGTWPIADLDDDSTTLIRGGARTLMCLEGTVWQGKRKGFFDAYYIDSLDHSKRYKVWEKFYDNDKINGPMTVYTLRGTVYATATFKDDSLAGPSREYWIDGKHVLVERVYEYGGSNYTKRTFYHDGQLQEEQQFRDYKREGYRKYYYPNGQLWIEQTFKDDLAWDVIANYTAQGQKRDAGTLHHGNGTIVFYNEDGSVRETATYRDGVEQHS